MGKFQEDLRHYMEAGRPMLYVDALEYAPVEALLRKAADSAEPKRGIIRWTQQGWRDEMENHAEKGELLASLDAWLMDNENLARRILIIEDVHFFLERPEIAPPIISRLRELARRINEGEIEDCIVVLLAPLGNLPKELEHCLTVMTPDFLTSEEIKTIIKQFVDERDLQLEPVFLDNLTMEMKGLSESAIENILALAYEDDGRIDKADLPLVREQKQQVVKKSGILEMVELKEKMNDIGGLENLKSWLTSKAKVFNNIQKAQKYGVDVPKGVLLAGMPGCGKSLTAKAAACEFEVPLLRLDMGRLMGKYVGESETNMRRAIQLAEASAPCVLWVDELEKAFAGVGGGGSEVTTRLFGHFLTWMQEKTSMVFVFATANKVKGVLPPELLRKGRFDEIFYVDLPNTQERKKIFEIHIGKRRPKDLDNLCGALDKLAEKTKGYCGADIEGVVKESVEAAFIDGDGKRSLTVADIERAIRETHSLSEIMGKDLEDLKKSYEEGHFKKASR